MSLRIKALGFSVVPYVVHSFGFKAGYVEMLRYRDSTTHSACIGSGAFASHTVQPPSCYMI